MNDLSYDYMPLTPPRKRRVLALWVPIFLVALGVINIVALKKLQLPPGPLDGFQNLCVRPASRHISAIIILIPCTQKLGITSIRELCVRPSGGRTRRSDVTLFRGIHDRRAHSGTIIEGREHHCAQDSPLPPTPHHAAFSVSAPSERVGAPARRAHPATGRRPRRLSSISRPVHEAARLGARQGRDQGGRVHRRRHARARELRRAVAAALQPSSRGRHLRRQARLHTELQRGRHVRPHVLCRAR